MMIPFGSRAAWDAWIGQHRPAMAGLGAAIAAEVGGSGLVEPLTGIRRRPAEISTNLENLGESLSAAEMNARKRALLLTLGVALHGRGGEAAPVVHAPEGGLRTARVLAEIFPAPGPVARQGGGLQAIALPDGAADALVVADALDFVEDRNAAWREMRRVVRPGGVLVASPRFHPGRQGAQPGQAAGWEILDALREAGWSRAAMVLVASSRHGIAASGLPGVFILVAAGERPEGGARHLLGAAEDHPLPGKVCLLVALPRSGTTLLTALFDVHSRFDAVFEPWNARALAGPEDAALETLLDRLGLRRDPGRFLFVKETAADTRYIDHMARLYDSMALPLDRQVLMLCRRPAHTFLSEIDRRNEWWGDNVALDAQQFDLWCAKSRKAVRDMLALLDRAGGLLVCYERLAEDPGAMLRRLAAAIGFEVEPQQLEFERHVDRRKVRGDLNVARNPERISVESIRRRAEQEAQVEEFARRSAHGDWFAAFTALHALGYESGLCPAGAIPEGLMRRLTA
ncbi:sulfotransferase family protein [Crenalkalicoccus roseus]|uniref:sulfotransferase family protein n=1 Tax=Crenalkalicoccus roseus TaxID=1485588 RepID=UPI001EFFEC07|nr:sulfotransferase [Crenalkalicoccus roseus]